MSGARAGMRGAGGGARQLLKTALFAVFPRRSLRRKAPGDAVHLTFDDGPHPAGTERILDILAEKGARATFFVVSQDVRRHPELARRIVRDGHVIAGHSWSHRRSPHWGFREVWREFDEGRRVIEEVCGVSTRLYRPPYGRLTLPLLLYALLGRVRVALWSLDSHDSRDASVEEVLATAERLGPGDVLLLHDDSPAAIEALPRLIDRLREKGLRLDALHE